MLFRKLRSLFCTILISTGAATLAQNTIRVPVDQPTIQAAINAANTGDTVFVAPGTYRENIDFKGKAITVTSAAAATAIIDGGGLAPTVTFQSHEPRSATLSNLTITHGGIGPVSGQPFAGAGISIADSTPTLLNNVVTQNYCTNIKVSSGGPLIQGNTVSASLNPEKCSVSETGGINITGTYDPLTNTPALIIGNTIEGNTTGQIGLADADGGAGIWNSGAGTVILNNTIRNNSTVKGNGGGIYTIAAPTSIVQNIIYGNFAGCGGGAIASADGGSQAAYSVLVANNTIVDNTGGGSTAYKGCKNAAQIYADPERFGISDPSTAFLNNIISGATTNPAIECGTLSTSPRGEAFQPRFDHNILFNSGAAFFGTLCVDTSSTYGNLVADPQFVNASTHDYHLKATSTAIDSGNNAIFPTFAQMTGTNLTLDFQGNPRAQDATAQGYAIIDRGAYEYSAAAAPSATSVVLTANAYAGNPGSDYSLTATVVSPLGIPSGSVTFTLDGKQLGVSVLDATGVATLGHVALNPGAHNVIATYGGQAGFPAATSVVVIISVNPYPTTLTLNSSATPSIVGQAVTFSITSYSADTTFIPSPIALTDSTTGAALATLTPDSTGKATYTTSALALGLHTISAAFAGDAIHAAGTAILIQNVITGSTTFTSLTSSLNPSVVGQKVTFTAAVTSADGTPTGSMLFADGASVLANVPLNAAGIATFSTSTLTIGVHTITATFIPTGNFGGSSASLQQTVNPIADIVALTSSLNPSTYGQSVTFTAHISSNIGAAVDGVVAFYDGTTLLASGPLDASATATYTTATLAVGSHPISAVFTQTGSTTTYSGSLTQIVNGQATSAVLTANPTSGVALITPVTLTLIVSTPAAGSSTLAGTATFYLNNAPLTTVPLVNGAASYTGTFPAGSNQVYATYSNDPTNIHSPSTSNIVTITMSTTPTSLTLTSSANPSPAFVPITFSAQLFVGTGVSTLSGQTIVFSIDGAIAGNAKSNSQGIATFTTPGLPAGPHTIAASYAGDGTHDPSTAATLTEQVNPDATTTILAGPTGTITELDRIGLLATVQSAYSSAVPTGSVTIFEGATALGAGVLAPSDSASTVSFDLLPLAAGTHSLVAVFTPNNGSFLPSQSVPFSLIVLPASLTLTLSEPTLTLQTGHHQTETVTLTSVGALGGTFSLGCGGTLPAYTSCTWSAASVNLAVGGTASTTVTIDTDQLVGFLAQNRPASSFLHREWAATTLATLLPLTLLGFRRRKNIRPLLSILLLATLATTLTGCGANKYPDSTAPGTYVIPITASAPAAPGGIAATRTVNLTLIVTP